MEKQYSVHVKHCLLKCAQCILSSRINDTAPADKRRSRWFLLELEELPTAAPFLEPSKRDPCAPLELEVYMQVPQTSPDELDLSALPNKDGYVFLEQWVLQYGAIPGPPTSLAGTIAEVQQQKQQLLQGASSGAGLSGSGGSLGGGVGQGGGRSYVDDASVYKRLTLLVRALYSHLRMLPAFRLARTFKRSSTPEHGLLFAVRQAGVLLGGSGAAASCAWRNRPGTSSGLQPSPPGGSVGCTVGTPGVSCLTQHFSFAPVETPGGSFRVSVEHTDSHLVSLLEHALSKPTIAEPRVIIPNYIPPPPAPPPWSPAPPPHHPLTGTPYPLPTDPPQPPLPTPSPPPLQQSPHPPPARLVLLLPPATLPLPPQRPRSPPPPSPLQQQQLLQLQVLLARWVLLPHRPLPELQLLRGQSHRVRLWLRMTTCLLRAHPQASTA